MEDLTRINLYKYMIENTDYRLSENLKMVFRINSEILRSIEPLFHYEEYNEINNEGLKNKTLNSILSDNLSNCRKIVYSENQPNRLINNFEKLISKISKISFTGENQKSSFNSLLREIREWSDKNIDEDVLDIKNMAIEIKEYQYMKYNKVFLSYAYEDRLYTIGLFYYLLSFGVYLHVDWMHSEKISCGKLIKSVLHKEINSSNQFLFLQSINMELKLPGNQGIRTWCSWELGNFYDIKNRSKIFYLSIYNKNNEGHKVLEGIPKLQYIKNRELGG